jgi:hypothetical protein
MRLLLILTLISSSAFAAKWYAPSGNLSEVQKTVNSASTGDTVVIPAGEFHWHGTLSIKKSIKLKGHGPGYTVITRSTPLKNNALISIRPPADVPVRITGIRFNAGAIGQDHGRLPSVSVTGPQGGNWGLTQIRIDHCYFDGGLGTVEWNFYAYGVVDHCTFLDCPYAVMSYADGDNAWARPIEFGTSNEDYIEDCTFIMDSNISYFDQLTDSDFGGRICMRYCKVDFSKFTAA